MAPAYGTSVAALPEITGKYRVGDIRNCFARPDQVFDTLKEQATGEQCEAMKGLIKEGELFIPSKDRADVRDAGLIGAAQRVEHYEMAGYGTALGP